MARSRPRGKRKRRASVSCYLKEIVDATEDFVDDVLDNADEFECDIRHSLSKALEGDDDDDDRDRDRDRDCDHDDDDDWDRSRNSGRKRSPARTPARAPAGSQDRSRDREEQNRREIARLRAELAGLNDKIAEMSADQK